MNLSLDLIKYSLIKTVRKVFISKPSASQLNVSDVSCTSYCFNLNYKLKIKWHSSKSNGADSESHKVQVIKENRIHKPAEVGKNWLILEIR